MADLNALWHFCRVWVDASTERDAAKSHSDLSTLHVYPFLTSSFPTAARQQKEEGKYQARTISRKNSTRVKSEKTIQYDSHCKPS